MKTPSAKGTVVSSTGWAASPKGDGGTLSSLVSSERTGGGKGEMLLFSFKDKN